ncbi:MAG TPA: hypothetical protein VMD97_09335 [Candidatus Aquilonibacter sp.]|nr:hypothetical protein [Candidatus Aquilonibacter sp.]
MTRTRHRDRSTGAQPLSLRVAVFLSILLVGVAGIAQAAHIHGDWLPKSAAQISAHTTSSSGISEDDCPLCMAMHSALPVAGFAALVVALLLEAGTFAFLSREPRSPWHFAAFSRPPPTILNL